MWCTAEMFNIAMYSDSKICQADGEKKREVNYKFGECMSMGGTFVMATGASALKAAAITFLAIIGSQFWAPN